MGLLTSPAWAQSPSPDLRGIYIYTNGLAAHMGADLSAALSASFSIPGIDGVAVVVGWATVEPAMSEYDWSVLDQWIGQVVALGKKIDLVVPAGSSTPPWLFQPPPVGAGATELSFTVSPHDGETGYCDTDNIAAPWDPAFLAQWDAMLAALSAHLQRAGTYSAITLVRLTGINRTSEELRLPAETAQSTGLACVTDAIATWQQAGYRPALLLQGWNAVISSFEKSFPGKSFAVSIIATDAFPPIDQNGAVITGTPPDPNQPLLMSSSQMFPGRLVVQLDFLMPGLAASTAVTQAAQNLGTLAAYQTNEYLGANGAACAGPETDATPCTDATFLALLETGIYPLGQSNPLRSQYIEVFHDNAAAFPDDILQAHFQLIPPGPCAVTGDGTPSVADVQQMVREALGFASPSNDLNGDGVVNVADVQIDIQAVLSQVCLAGSQTQSLAKPQSHLRAPAPYVPSHSSLALAALPASFTDLGTLGGESATAYSLNDLGQVVGASDTGQKGPPKSACPRCAISHAFLWVAGQMTDLDRENTGNSAAYSINFAGQIAGVYSDSGRYFAGFLYSGGAITALSQVSRGTVSAMNDSGQIIGGLAPENADSQQAFVWNAGTVMNLGTLGGTGSQARAINDSGQVAGFADVSGDSAVHAFLYSGGGPTDLGTLGGKNSMAYGLNRMGQVAGASQIADSSFEHAFLYTGGAMMDLGTLEGRESGADAINNSGMVVGWSDTSGGEQHAFLWASRHMVDLNSLVTVAPGVWLTEATSLNDNGQIVANASNGHAYLISLAVQFR
jgi:probable HAF family extracellular repeat protein